MLKNTLLFVLAICFCLCSIFPVFAAEDTAASAVKEPVTVEELVNAMTLEPKRPKNKEWNTVLKYIDEAVKGKETNFEKLTAIYDKILADDKIIYNGAFQFALEVIGFRTYSVSGWNRSDDGSLLTLNCVGIDIDGKPYFFDVYLPQTGDYTKEQCFAAPYSPKDANKIYNSPQIREMFYLTPADYDAFADVAGSVVKTSDGFPEDPKKRAEYHAGIEGLDRNSAIPKPNYPKPQPPVRINGRYN